VCIDVLLSWGTSKFAAVPVRQDERTIGQSGYNLVKLIRHAVNMMTGFSHTPLQLASFLGFAFMLFGLGILAYVLGRYFIFGAGVAGLTFLASAIAIFSGVQLIVLGIMGEYLARMHARMLERPTYAVRDVARSSADAEDPE
jgi:undecaprenyl-phosphate 4-deoxy-4-formamido-L-arabinose transferase